MALVSRTDRSPFGRWWWTVDHWTLAAIGCLIAAGALLSLAASPSVATRIGLEPFHFVYRQILFIGPAAAIIFLISLLDPKTLLKLAAVIFGGFWVALAGTLLVGPEIKGATRWLAMGPFSFQPSEFVKPALIVLCASALATPSARGPFFGVTVALTLFASTVAILILQPDFGQAMLITVAFAALLFFWGVSFVVMAGLGVFAAMGAFLAYRMLPHVASRVDRFLDPKSGDGFQTQTALKAFETGGIGGVGPGEGKVKGILPDAHTDFIFSVAGEEFGLIVCLALMAGFAVIVLRSLYRSASEQDRFVQLAASGLAVLFGAQALINMAVNLNLIPAKGMTLPFVSYGGSSMLALALTAGMLLSLTRKRPSIGRHR